MSGGRAGTPAMQGYLQKRIMLSMNHRRWFELDGTVLQWRRDRSDSDVKKRLQLSPITTIERAGTTLTITVAENIVVVTADSITECDRWHAALTAACGSPSGNGTVATVTHVALPRPSAEGLASPGVPRKGSTESAGLFPAPASLPLPERVRIEGTPEVGSELRLCASTAPNNGDAMSLELLCLQWVRIPGDAYTLRDAAVPGVDLLTLPGAKSIQSAVAECYSVVEDDVGYRLGCSVRRAAGGGASRWAMLVPVATSRPPGALRLRAELRAHEHSKYCDRRVRVCTAAGRYREGAVLKAVPVGSPDVLAQYSVAWYRSGASAADGSATTDLAPIATGGDDAGHLGTLISTPSTAVAAGSVTRYALTRPRPVAHLPPAPPDYEPSLPLDELKRRLALGQSTWPVQGAPLPAHPRADAVAAGTAPCDYPLFVGDVGCLITCALVPVGVEPPTEIIIGEGIGATASTTAPTLPLSCDNIGRSVSASINAKTPGTPTTVTSSSPAAAPPIQLQVASVAPMPRPPAAPRRTATATAPSSPGGVAASPTTAGAAPASPTAFQAVAFATATTVPPTAATASATSAAPSSQSFVLSPPVGPVEAAPPRAREVWIEGTPAVGSTLTGHVYYFGGVMGPKTEVSWVAINDDGEQVELAPFAPAAKLQIQSPAGTGVRARTSSGTSYPTASLLADAALLSAPVQQQQPAAFHAPLSSLVLQPEHVGHLVKFRVRPARNDGDVGHTESSRPTAEITST